MVEERKRRNGLIRYGRGLNSFVTRPVKLTPAVHKQREYYVRGLVSGGFEVVEKHSGKIAASQFDNRDEAFDWIKDQSGIDNGN